MSGKRFVGKADVLTLAGVRARLAGQAAAAGGQAALARQLGLSRAYICQVIGGAREPGPAILKYLKLRARPREYETR